MELQDYLVESSVPSTGDELISNLAGAFARETVAGNYVRRTMCANLSKRVYQDSVEEAGDIVKFIKQGATSDGRGYNKCQILIRLDNEHKTIYIAYKGTSKPMDFIRDVNIDNTKAEHSGLQVHSGFKSPVEGSLNDVEAVINEHDRNINSVVFCGHSLGGAYAGIAHLELSEKWKKEESPLSRLQVETYTFGAPWFYHEETITGATTKIEKEKVAQIALKIAKYQTEMYHFIHNFDLVPRGFAVDTYVLHFIVDNVRTSWPYNLPIINAWVTFGKEAVKVEMTRVEMLRKGYKPVGQCYLLCSSSDPNAYTLHKLESTRFGSNVMGFVGTQTTEKAVEFHYMENYKKAIDGI